MCSTTKCPDVGRWRIEKLGNKGYYLFDLIKQWHCNDEPWTYQYAMSILHKLPPSQIDDTVHYYG